MEQFDNQDLNNQQSESFNNNEQYSPVQFNPEPSPVTSFSLNLSLSDLKNLTGWATFRAILEIIVGALSCFGIITAAFGIPQIISGVKLLNAVDELKRYIASNDIEKISASLGSMRQYFRLRGIASIVMMCFYIVFIIVYIVFIVYLVSHDGGFLREFSNSQNYNF